MVALTRVDAALILMAWIAIDIVVLTWVVVRAERRRMRAQRRAARRMGYIGEVPAGGDKRW